jgi:Na+-translocating ferredoxin:NAD+ oxidoreductase RnfE subunit
VKNNGIRCITTPCPNLLESKLNSTKSQIIDNVFAPSDELTSSISNGIFSGKPVVVVVIVIGDLREITTQTTTAERTWTVRSRDAVAVFTRIGK